MFEFMNSYFISTPQSYSPSCLIFSFKITTKVAANWTFLDGSVLFCWTPAVQTLKCFTTFCSYQRLSSFHLEIAWIKAPVSAEQQSGESKEDQNITDVFSASSFHVRSRSESLPSHFWTGSLSFALDFLTVFSSSVWGFQVTHPH